MTFPKLLTFLDDEQRSYYLSSLNPVIVLSLSPFSTFLFLLVFSLSSVSCLQSSVVSCHLSVISHQYSVTIHQLSVTNCLQSWVLVSSHQEQSVFNSRPKSSVIVSNRQQPESSYLSVFRLEIFNFNPIHCQGCWSPTPLLYFLILF